MRNINFIQLLFGVAAILLMHSCDRLAYISIRHESYTEEDSITRINVSYNILSSQDKDLDRWLGKINDSISVIFKSAADSLKIDSASDSLGFHPYLYHVTDSVFAVSPKLYSCKYTVDTCTGGMHDFTSFVSLNLLPDKKVILDKEQIFKNDSNSVSAIDNILNRCFDKVDPFFHTPSLDLVNVVNLTPDGVLFTFGNGILGPYSSGPAEIFVPKDMILPYLNSNIADIYKK